MMFWQRKGTTLFRKSPPMKPEDVVSDITSRSSKNEPEKLYDVVAKELLAVDDEPKIKDA